MLKFYWTDITNVETESILSYECNYKVHTT